MSMEIHWKTGWNLNKIPVEIPMEMIVNSIQILIQLKSSWNPVENSMKYQLKSSWDTVEISMKFQ